jgi:hypothetical protein
MCCRSYWYVTFCLTNIFYSELFLRETNEFIFGLLLKLAGTKQIWIRTSTCSVESPSKKFSWNPCGSFGEENCGQEDRCDLPFMRYCHWSLGNNAQYTFGFNTSCRPTWSHPKRTCMLLSWYACNTECMERRPWLRQLCSAIEGHRRRRIFMCLLRQSLVILIVVLQCVRVC